MIQLFLVKEIRLTSRFSLNRSPESWAICWKEIAPSIGGPRRMTRLIAGQSLATCKRSSAIGATPKTAVAPP